MSELAPDTLGEIQRYIHTSAQAAFGKQPILDPEISPGSVKCFFYAPSSKAAETLFAPEYFGADRAISDLHISIAANGSAIGIPNDERTYYVEIKGNEQIPRSDQVFHQNVVEGIEYGKNSGAHEQIHANVRSCLKPSLRKDGGQNR